MSIKVREGDDLTWSSAWLMLKPDFVLSQIELNC